MAHIKERTVEQYLKDSVEAAGGLCIKVKASGVKGVPDRIVVLEGVTMFVELKSKSGKLSIHQRKLFRKIQAAGGLVFVLDNKDGVDDFMVFCLQNLAEEPLIWTPGPVDS